MSNELKQALTEFMKALLEGMKKGTELASNEIPLVIKEVLKYNLIVDCLMMVLAIGMTGTLVYFSYKAQKRANAIEDLLKSILKNGEPKTPYERSLEHTIERKVGQSADWVIFSWILMLGSAIPCLLFISYLTEVLKITFAPRLFIIEWLKGMM